MTQPLDLEANLQATLPGMERSEGEKRLEAGATRVLENEPEVWRFAALHCILEVSRRMEFFTADDVMAEAVRQEIGKPHHPNAWGAVYRIALHDGAIMRTGKFVKSTRPGQHATMIPQYTAAGLGPDVSDE